MMKFTKPLENVVELGVQLSPAPGQSTNISLLYTDVALHSVSQSVASFVVPSLADQWARLALRVGADNVTLFLNCDEYDTVAVKREPRELVFDSASTLYVGQAGPLIKGAFDVSPPPPSRHQIASNARTTSLCILH
ncbi:Uncharacterized protein GBIM_06167 [Gryllus bimaculatus]|nr:Uncharacterized protein GBIM_06167 [Gryllus bimaculatus]